jgi:hypothetical protein
MVPDEYLVPYLISNAVALTILALAFRRPIAVKWIWAAIFVWAAAANSLTASGDPRVYLVYGALTPSETYRVFIEGWFSRHIQQMVLSIAVGQLVLAALLIRTDRARRRLGVAGAVVFLLAIAPLGVGSAFPFSLIAAASLLVMEWRISLASRHQVPPASRFIPHPDAHDDHAIEIHAPADLVFDAAKHVDLVSDRLVSALIRIRAFVMRDRPAPPRATGGLVPETLALGWGVLSYSAGRTLIMGAVARPWARDVTFSAVEPSQFSSFCEPDLVKIVWTLEAEPRSAAVTCFRSETRVQATGPDARRRFRRYWFLVSPGVRLIRWRILRALRREAERRYRTESARVVKRAA